MLLDRVVGHNLAVVVESNDKNHLLRSGNLAHKLAVAPFLASLVGVLEQWRS